MGKETKLTRRRLVAEVADAANVPGRYARWAVSAVIERMAKALAAGRGIELRGFGTFTIRQRRKTRRMIPQTDRIVAVPPGLFVHFRASSGLSARPQGLRPGRGVAQKANSSHVVRDE